MRKRRRTAQTPRGAQGRGAFRDSGLLAGRWGRRRLLTVSLCRFKSKGSSSISISFICISSAAQAARCWRDGRRQIHYASLPGSARARPCCSIVESDSMWLWSEAKVRAAFRSMKCKLGRYGGINRRLRYAGNGNENITAGRQHNKKDRIDQESQTYGTAY